MLAGLPAPMWPCLCRSKSCRRRRRPGRQSRQSRPWWKLSGSACWLRLSTCAHCFPELSLWAGPGCPLCRQHSCTRPDAVAFRLSCDSRCISAPSQICIGRPLYPSRPPPGAVVSASCQAVSPSTVKPTCCGRCATGVALSNVFSCSCM